MNKKLETTLFQKNDNGEMRDKARRLNTLQKYEKKITDTPIHNNALDDPHTNNTAISAEHKLNERGSTEFRPQSRKPRGVLMPGSVSISSQKGTCLHEAIKK
jgi:hypothetical protein